jgi:photosynthetic reaction center cytochrome c subunit
MSLAVRSTGALATVLLASFTIASYRSTETSAIGAPGEGMQITESREALAAKLKANEAPPALPPANREGQLAVDAYKNVQVLGHLTTGEFTRLMTAITLWVSPKEGCAYCHAPERDAKGNIVRDEDGNPQADLRNMGSDELYAKRVARRMIQLTQHVNADWKQHVAATGVTCYTCHRGQPVPANVWFDAPPSPTEDRMLGYTAHQNAPATVAGLSSLPSDALQVFLAGNASDSIRVQATVPIDSQDRSSTKQAEWTYALMMHFSQSLGVNCTFCHNSRAWNDWSESPVKRNTAWYGIRMVRELNQQYVEPLRDVLPPGRLGPTGDGPKVGCATCHQGAYKPLLGVSMLKDYDTLAEPKPQPAKSPPPEAAVDGGAASATVDGGEAAGDGGAVSGTADGGATGDGGAASGTADGGAAVRAVVDGGALPAPAPSGRRAPRP